MDTPSEFEIAHLLEQADTAYQPYAPFSVWAAEPVGLGSWDDAAARLAALREQTPVEDVRSAMDEVLRAAAVDTGAIEGLYRADRGFTFLVARNRISLDQAEAEAGQGFRRNYEAQLAGFELALHLARGDEVITEAALREVHRITCAGQSTHRVLTPVGFGTRELPLGTYKAHPNHVRLVDGSLHSYAPVDRVAEEMHRLVTEMRSDVFLAAPAVVQAAFSHHALTTIHPFADGNGRVARLLASVWLLRAASIPLWVETSDRARYLDALSAADGGDRQPFLRFVTSAGLGLLRDLALTIEAPPGPVDPAIEDVIAEEAAAELAAMLRDQIGERRDALVAHPAAVTGPIPDGTRVPAHATIVFESSPPQPARIDPRGLVVGIDERADGANRFCVLVFDRPSGGALIRQERLEADILVPKLSPAGRRRLAQIARLILRDARAAHRPGQRDP